MNLAGIPANEVLECAETRTPDHESSELARDPVVNKEEPERRSCMTGTLELAARPVHLLSQHLTIERP